MKPLINSGPKRNFVLVIRPIANLFGVPPMETILKRGDVVSVVSPKNPNDCFLKRVIGLPGDIVETITYKRKFVRVPDGHCWIEGAIYYSKSFNKVVFMALLRFLKHF
jgi:signal peptidase I